MNGTPSEFAPRTFDRVSVTGLRARRRPAVEVSASSAALVPVSALLGRENLGGWLFFTLKTWMDRFVAAALLIPALPMIGVLVILVRLASRGPGIYRQVRVGRGGRLFMLYKIRTMRLDAEESVGPVWSPPHDPRVTRLGRILRWSHLDELPQLFNVLRGQMCLVGPRPERPEIVRDLTRQIPGYLDRLNIPPGITGLAQITLPPDTNLASVRRKLAYDVAYIRSASFFLDFRIALCTALRLVGIRGSLARKVCWLKSFRLEPDGAAIAVPIVADPDAGSAR